MLDNKTRNKQARETFKKYLRTQKQFAEGVKMQCSDFSAFISGREVGDKVLRRIEHYIEEHLNENSKI
jgi:hypothetical protein